MRYLRQRYLYIFAALLAVCGLVFSHSTAQAGADAVKLVVKDPKSGVEFEVTEPDLLGFFAFTDLNQPLPQAPAVSNGYEITRYWSNGPFDHFHYYPGTENNPGYIYYDGFIQGLSDSDGKWYQTHAEAEHAMLQLLKAHHLLSQRTQPASILLLIIGAVVALIILMGMGVYQHWLRKRVIQKPVL